jgi:hypothetical protein
VESKEINETYFIDTDAPSGHVGRSSVFAFNPNVLEDSFVYEKINKKLKKLNKKLNKVLKALGK